MRHIGAWYREEPGNRGGNHGMTRVPSRGVASGGKQGAFVRARNSARIMPGPNFRRDLNDPGIAKLKISHSMRVSECRRRLGSLGLGGSSLPQLNSLDGLR